MKTIGMLSGALAFLEVTVENVLVQRGEVLNKQSRCLLSSPLANIRGYGARGLAFPNPISHQVRSLACPVPGFRLHPLAAVQSSLLGLGQTLRYGFQGLAMSHLWVSGVLQVSASGRFVAASAELSQVLKFEHVRIILIVVVFACTVVLRTTGARQTHGLLVGLRAARGNPSFSKRAFKAWRI